KTVLPLKVIRETTNLASPGPGGGGMTGFSMTGGGGGWVYSSCFFFCSSACRCCSKRIPGVSGESVCAWTVDPASAAELMRAAPKSRLIFNPTGKWQGSCKLVYLAHQGVLLVD